MSIQKYDTVFINDLLMDAIIGIYDHERIHHQPIKLTIEMAWDNRRAGKSDDIAHTLDYEKVSNFIKDYVQKSAFLLVEALTENLAREIIERFKTPAITINLQKLEAISNTQSVGVRIHRTSADYQ